MATNEIGITEQEFLQAAKLLEDDNLVWSADLDTIRKDLAKYLREMAEKGAISNSHLSQVVRRFIAD